MTICGKGDLCTTSRSPRKATEKEEETILDRLRLDIAAAVTKDAYDKSTLGERTLVHMMWSESNMIQGERHTLLWSEVG